MNDQYMYDFQAQEARYLRQSGMNYQTGYQNDGGYLMIDRQQSHASINSESSHSSNSCYSTPTSPLQTITPKYEFENYSLAPQSYETSINGSSFPTAERVKHTPTSLGWTRGTDLLKMYAFHVPKGAEPYLKLLDPWTPTYQTPAIVYLDEAKGLKKNQFPCLYPGQCNGKQSVFSRPADLERHYRNLHAENKDSYPCDYAKCIRSREPFTRKDHYRDHLRDFHQEDIGRAKIEKQLKGTDKQKWEEAQQNWLNNRKINKKYWRCAKCLQRNSVALSGWHCSGSGCNIPCEDERRRAREGLAPERLNSDDYSTDSIEENAQFTSTPLYQICATCNGSGLVPYCGSWAFCPICQATALSYDFENPREDVASGFSLQ